MKYTVINNNKRNFKIQYDVEGKLQEAHLQDDQRQKAINPPSKP